MTKRNVVKCGFYNLKILHDFHRTISHASPKGHGRGGSSGETKRCREDVIAGMALKNWAASAALEIHGVADDLPLLELLFLCFSDVPSPLADLLNFKSSSSFVTSRGKRSRVVLVRKGENLRKIFRSCSSLRKGLFGLALNYSCLCWYSNYKWSVNLHGDIS